MVSYIGKKIVILGLGITGISCVDFFIRKGVVPRVMDYNIQISKKNTLPKYIKCWFGKFNKYWLLSSDLIVVSPGISSYIPELIVAKKAGIEIVSDIELFCREINTPIIAITGSNGKSTVVALVGRIIKSSGLIVSVGGNIGIPVLTLLKKPAQIYVIEISSFQLENTHCLRSLASTVLNIHNDHIDRYPLGMSQYQNIKLRIYKHAQICLFNFDDLATKPSVINNQRLLSFGITSGDYHLNNYLGNTWLLAKGERLIKVDQIKLIGNHNYINILSALALSDILEIPKDLSINVIKNFSGLNHRLQLIYHNDGVRWINDSKSTNIDSTVAALNSLKISKENTIWLLLGGIVKSMNFQSLQNFISNNSNVRLFCFGRSNEILAQICPEITTKTDTLMQAVKFISSQTKFGDVVLLSPACSSLDQFKNFKHRGRMFSVLARRFG